MKKLLSILLGVVLLTALALNASAATFSYGFEDVQSWDLTSMLMPDPIHKSGETGFRLKTYGAAFDNSIRTTNVEPWGDLTYEFNNSRRTLLFNYDAEVIPAGKYTANFWIYDPNGLLEMDETCPVQLYLTFHPADVNDGNLGNGWVDEDLTIAAVPILNFVEGGAKATGKTQTVDGNEWLEYTMEVNLAKDAASSALFYVQEAAWVGDVFMYIDDLVLTDGKEEAPVETAAPETEAPETEAPAETAAPETEAPAVEEPETVAPVETAPATTPAPQTFDITSTLLAIFGVSALGGALTNRKKK